ncbi:glycosyltransferase family 4 protein, partial [Candidatus Gottesmanbacteria bacterium]|nr:glycosyltransferase family 4 protein [Candidatus Gottesmanbacteria bacterium]
MKILFSVTYYHPYVSGLTICAGRIAKGFADLGHDVTALAFQHDPQLPKAENISGVKVKRVAPLIRLNKGFLSLAWWSESWKSVEECDALVINLPQAEGWIPALFAKLQHKRIIAIYHCEVNLGNEFINQVVQVILEIANTITLLLADVVVTYTQDYADHSRLLKYVKDKVVTQYPPVDLPEVNLKVKKRLEKQIRSNRSDIIIGVAARLAREKGIEYLLEAMPLLKKKFYPPSGGSKFQIIVAGPLDPVGELAYKVKIMQLVEKYKDNVVFLGSLTQAEMSAFYSLLDVLVLPSVNSTEAFGLV